MHPISNKKFSVLEVAGDAQVHGLDDEWNQGEIIVMGDEYVIHKLNGEVVNMVINLDFDKGPIALKQKLVRFSGEISS